jgi:hypothetical protein
VRLDLIFLNIIGAVKNNTILKIFQEVWHFWSKKCCKSYFSTAKNSRLLFQQNSFSSSLIIFFPQRNARNFVATKRELICFSTFPNLIHNCYSNLPLFESLLATEDAWFFGAWSFGLVV